MVWLVSMTEALATPNRSPSSAAEQRTEQCGFRSSAHPAAG
jgi:hypothetical protein